MGGGGGGQEDEFAFNTTNVYQCLSVCLSVAEMYMGDRMKSSCTLPGHVSPDKHVIVRLNDEAHVGKETTAHQVHIFLHLLRTTQQISKPHATSKPNFLTQKVNVVRHIQ